MTTSEGVRELSDRLRRMEALTDQTAVHRKKFEFALSQLRKFCQVLSSNPDDCSESQLSAIRKQFHALRGLIIQNLLQNWSSPTIDNPSNWVLEQLREIFTGIHAASSPSTASESIDADAPQWSQYNLLDLRAIHASFTQYVRAKNVDAQLARSIETRLASLGGHLAAGDAETSASRVFSPIPINYQAWRVDHADYDELRQIGGGVSALVFYGRSRLTGEEVAIKKFKFQKLNGSKLQTFQREVACLATANHPAVLKLIGATDTPPFCIITEWMPNGSLFHDLHQYHRLDPTGRTIAAFDIARGMQFLHSCHIVHRDMKSLNVLLDARYRIRICDFGFSRYATEDSQMTQNLGTPHWMAPEVLTKNANYTSKVDVYAYGIVLWELATGVTPYQGMDAAAIVQQVQQYDIRPAMPADITPGVRDLMTACWDRNPDARPTFDEIVRRFQTERIAYPGANRDEFMRHVRDSATTGELIVRDIERVLKKLVGGELTLREATERFRVTGIPPEMLEKVWTALIGMLGRFAPEDVAQYLTLFAKSSWVKEAITILQGMEIGRIPPDAVSAFVTEIPIGSQELDTHIVVLACQNGAADLCAVYATRASDITLAFEIVARHGVDVQLRPAVIDRCVQSLGSADADLAAAALKCLLAIRELKRVNAQRLAGFVASQNRALSGCAFLAVGVLSGDGTFPPIQLFDETVWALREDPRAALAVVPACKDAGLAERLLQLLEEDPPQATEGLLKAVACAARHPPLRPRIAKLFEERAFVATTGQLASAVARLLSKIGQE